MILSWSSDLGHESFVIRDSQRDSPYFHRNAEFFSQLLKNVAYLNYKCEQQSFDPDRWESWDTRISIHYLEI